MCEQAILRKLLQRLQAELGDDLVGVIAGGSRLRGEGDANSDIDVVIVVARHARKRWNLLIDGVEIEMFLNPQFQMQVYFERERVEGRPVMPHLCATGIILFDPQGVMADLKTQGRAVFDGGPAPLSDLQKWQTRYFTADSLRDIDDIKDRDEAAAALMIARLVTDLANHHYRLSGRWLVK
jgi:predicted nucleotidyltransferase